MCSDTVVLITPWKTCYFLCTRTSVDPTQYKPIEKTHSLHCYRLNQHKDCELELSIANWKQGRVNYYQNHIAILAVRINSLALKWERKQKNQWKSWKNCCCVWYLPPLWSAYVNLLPWKSINSVFITYNTTVYQYNFNSVSISNLNLGCISIWIYIAHQCRFRDRI